MYHRFVHTAHISLLIVGKPTEDGPGRNSLAAGCEFVFYDDLHQLPGQGYQ